MRQGRDTMAADRATTAADPACILVAVIISVTMAAITVVAVITGVVVTTVVVVIEYLSSARLSVTQADRDIPVRFFPLSFGSDRRQNPNGFKRSMRVAAENIVCINS
jgi:hypothetical protein